MPKRSRAETNSYSNLCYDVIHHIFSFLPSISYNEPTEKHWCYGYFADDSRRTIHRFFNKTISLDSIWHVTNVRENDGFWGADLVTIDVRSTIAWQRDYKKLLNGIPHIAQRVQKVILKFHLDCYVDWENPIPFKDLEKILNRCKTENWPSNILIDIIATCRFSDNSLTFDKERNAPNQARIHGVRLGALASENEKRIRSIHIEEGNYKCNPGFIVAVFKNFGQHDRIKVDFNICEDTQYWLKKEEFLLFSKRVQSLWISSYAPIDLVKYMLQNLKSEKQFRKLCTKSDMLQQLLLDKEQLQNYLPQCIEIDDIYLNGNDGEYSMNYGTIHWLLNCTNLRSISLRGADIAICKDEDWQSSSKRVDAKNNNQKIFNMQHCSFVETKQGAVWAIASKSGSCNDVLDHMQNCLQGLVQEWGLQDSE